MRVDRVVILCPAEGRNVWLAEATAEGSNARKLPIEAVRTHLATIKGSLLVGLDGVTLAADPALPCWPQATDGDLLAAEVSATTFAPDLDTATPEARARSMAAAFLALARRGALAELLADTGTPVLGANHAMLLRGALPAAVAPPRLKDDCFSMPQGVSWVPVDEALARLRSALKPVKGTTKVETAQARGYVLAEDAIARRSNPPLPNSAVDGYGFAQAATGGGPQRLPLVDGRSAAGQPYERTVPPGAAIRILTGAALPAGVDTVVLEEDCALDGTAVVFDGPVKPGANTRRAGEDVGANSTALPAGQRLRAPDLALASALGIAELSIFEKLRVGVLSTGDEIVASPALPAEPHQIWDANRPMLLGLAEGWGYETVDLGHVRDDRAEIKARLDAAADTVDLILTSGGASAGDEDHISALLGEKGTLSSWRIALKPGRPLVLATWQGVPVFGLPGNPVAALVCALIFARPALSRLAGAGWLEAPGFTVPAAFEKRKKAGRREYLRARLTADGTAEVFRSEGSGRISGLSWADGLVELPDDALSVVPDTPVRFMPYSGFGLF